MNFTQILLDEIVFFFLKYLPQKCLFQNDILLVWIMLSFAEGHASYSVGLISAPDVDSLPVERCF